MAEIKPFTPKKTITDLIIENLYKTPKTYTDLKNSINKPDTSVARGITPLMKAGIIVKNDKSQYILNKSHSDYKKTMQRHLLFPNNEKIYPILYDEFEDNLLAVFANGPNEKGFEKYIKKAFDTPEFAAMFSKIATTLTFAYMEYTLENTKDDISGIDMVKDVFSHNMGVHVVLSERK